MSVEQSVMRTSLLCNLLGAVARNLKYDVPDVGLFEIGSVFLPRGEGEQPDEPVQITGVVAGRRAGWLRPGEPVDLFHAKGILERLLDALLGARAVQVRFAATGEVPYLHPGVTARAMLGDQLLGHVGEVHPETRTAFEIDVPCFAFELELAAVPPLAPAQMSGIARYPAVTRDVSFFVDAEVPAGRVGEIISQVEEPLVERVNVLEDFRDPAYVPTGKKGMLWSVTYRSSERTLTDVEVNKAHEAIVSNTARNPRRRAPLTRFLGISDTSWVQNVSPLW